MNSVAPYAKAITGAIIAALSALSVALIPDSAAGATSNVTSSEWVTIAIAFLVALSAVWAIPNTDPEAEHQEESVQPPTPEVLPSDPSKPTHNSDFGA